jgi:hypothetical protein
MFPRDVDQLPDDVSEDEIDRECCVNGMVEDSVVRGDCDEVRTIMECEKPVTPDKLMEVDAEAVNEWAVEIESVECLSVTVMLEVTDVLGSTDTEADNVGPSIATNRIEPLSTTSTPHNEVVTLQCHLAP